jgi:putative ABC transport system substrate-binding protein
MAIGIARRQFISVLGGAAFGWPLAARAQQATTPVIGFLSIEAPSHYAARVTALLQGLSETGYVEHRNVEIEYRWAENQNDKLPALADDLVRHGVTVIIAPGVPAVRAARAATATIPIVFTVGVDPVQFGLVASLNRPGGNLTGVSNLNVVVEQKRLEFLHELVPTATLIGLLVNPNNSDVAERTTKDLQAAANSFGLQLHVLQAQSGNDFEAAFAALAQLRAGGLVIGNDGLFISRSEQLGALAARYAVPTIFQFHEFAAAGGLMSYGTDQADAYRQAGIYVGRILKGEKPTELPVVQSTKVNLIINLKTAKELGLTIPLALLGRADEVIE